MNRKRFRLIITVVVAVVILLVALSIVRSLARKEIFCGLEENRLKIPGLFVREMKSITRGPDCLWIHNLYVKNDSRRTCLKPVLTIKFAPDIVGYAVNGTDADQRNKGEWIHVRNERDLILMPEKLEPASFVDLTVWTNSPNILGESGILFSSDNDFEIKTKYTWYRTNEERFK